MKQASRLLDGPVFQHAGVLSEVRTKPREVASSLLWSLAAVGSSDRCYGRAEPRKELLS